MKWRNRLDLLGFATARDGISTKLDNIKLRRNFPEFSQRGRNISPGRGGGPPPPLWLRHCLGSVELCIHLPLPGIAEGYRN